MIGNHVPLLPQNVDLICHEIAYQYHVMLFSGKQKQKRLQIELWMISKALRDNCALDKPSQSMTQKKFKPISSCVFVYLRLCVVVCRFHHIYYIIFLKEMQIVCLFSCCCVTNTQIMCVCCCCCCVDFIIYTHHFKKKCRLFVVCLFVCWSNQIIKITGSKKKPIRGAGGGWEQGEIVAHQNTNRNTSGTKLPLQQLLLLSPVAGQQHH